jgi:hypothetical protein
LAGHKARGEHTLSVEENLVPLQVLELEHRLELGHVLLAIRRNCPRPVRVQPADEPATALTLLVVPDTHDLLPRRREAADEREVVARLDLARLVDDDGLDGHEPREPRGHHAAVGEHAERAEHDAHAAEHALHRDEVLREVVGAHHVRRDALVQVLVPVRGVSTGACEAGREADQSKWKSCETSRR